MNIAPKDISAAANPVRHGRHAIVRALLIGALAVGAIGSSAAAGMGQRDHDQAAGRDLRDGPGVQAPPAVDPRQQPQRGDARQYDARQNDGRQYDSRVFDMRGEEARRQQAQQQQQEMGGRRGGRLTPDERRELRRQINEAGMDLYPSSPRR